MKNAKKSIVILVGALGFTLGVSVNAATLNPNQAGGVFSCPEGSIGTWHFVNNKTGGATEGTLTATFDCGTLSTSSPIQVNNKSMQFNIYTQATCKLLNAETNLPGDLVLSDVTCDTGKKK